MKNRPEWFIRALETKKENKSVVVQGASINYQKWGNSGNPGLILVHGSGAHSHWWDFIAPLLIQDFEVIALDLSGMGDSEHRTKYSADIFAEEILGVAKDSNLFSDRPSPPVICGHSLGGWMGATAGFISKNKVKGVIMIDSPIRPPGFDYSKHRRSGPIRKIKTYPDKETIMGRFRLAPEQPCKNDFILDHIAKWSIKEVNDGFQWKFDDTIFEKLELTQTKRDLAFHLNCHLGIIYGAKSPMMSKEIMEYITSNVKERTPIRAIENAYHHVPLDKPLDLVKEIKSTIASWK